MKDRFSVAGTHIFDNRDEGWMPQAGTRRAAEMIVDKLNELAEQISKQQTLKKKVASKSKK